MKQLKQQQIRLWANGATSSGKKLQTMTYGAETWTLTQEPVHMIRVAPCSATHLQIDEIRKRTKEQDDEVEFARTRGQV